jgi:hypothetical protein
MAAKYLYPENSLSHGTTRAAPGLIMDELISLERKVQALYDSTLRPLAERLGFDLPMTAKDAPGRPTVLLLGNHSSGKSSFINFLLGTELQKTGLAPTDDGFTIITHGENRDTFDGQTVVTHPELAYRQLELLGSPFLAHLRLKTLPHELLQKVTLIDSPGMIDAVREGNTRGYDFSGGVRKFAEGADLILFFFDPHKPGTTGETISIFTETLAGMEHKLFIILNKVDQFENIRDFARTYGTLCWNLARAIRTKDIPHIYNIFVPGGAEQGAREQAPIPLQDFELSRQEVLSEIRRTPTRRADNLVSGLHIHARRLAVHARVCHTLASKWLARQVQAWAATAAVILLTLLGIWLFWNPEAPRAALLAGLIGAVTAVVVWFGGRHWLDRFKRRTTSWEGLDLIFREAYETELTLKERTDLRTLWESVKQQTSAAIRALGPGKLSGGYSSRRQLKRLESMLEDEVPRLRRSVTGSVEPELIAEPEPTRASR